MSRKRRNGKFFEMLFPRSPEPEMAGAGNGGNMEYTTFTFISAASVASAVLLLVVEFYLHPKGEERWIMSGGRMMNTSPRGNPLGVLIVGAMIAPTIIVLTILSIQKIYNFINGLLVGALNEM